MKNATHQPGNPKRTDSKLLSIDFFTSSMRIITGLTACSHSGRRAFMSLGRITGREDLKYFFECVRAGGDNRAKHNSMRTVVLRNIVKRTATWDNTITWNESQAGSANWKR